MIALELRRLRVKSQPRFPAQGLSSSPREVTSGWIMMSSSGPRWPPSSAASRGRNNHTARGIGPRPTRGDGVRARQARRAVAAAALALVPYLAVNIGQIVAQDGSFI